MKVQKWLSLGEAYAIPRLKGGIRTPVSGDKVVGSLKTPHLVTHVPKGVKHQISTIRIGDKK